MQDKKKIYFKVYLRLHYWPKCDHYNVPLSSNKWHTLYKGWIWDIMRYWWETTTPASVPLSNTKQGGWETLNFSIHYLFHISLFTMYVWIKIEVHYSRYMSGTKYRKKVNIFNLIDKCITRQIYYLLSKIKIKFSV